jgi:hypothetical protein
MMAGAVRLPMIESGKIKNRLAQRLAGDGPVVNADSANATGAIDNRDPLAQLSALNRGLLPSRAGTDNRQIVLSVYRQDLS